MKNIIKHFLPYFVVISAFCALVYASVQQSFRQGANDPQIQMAEDAAYALDHGTDVANVVSPVQVEMSRSLAPFIVLYDLQGEPVAGSGLLDGQLPAYPKGALDSTRQSGENRVTWQPTVEVRVASVVVPYKGGFVMAGRNLREVEIREAQVSQFAGMTWVLALAVTLVAIAAGEWLLKEKKY